MTINGWIDNKAAELIARKSEGGDCTQDESAWIKSYFDHYHPVETEQGRAMSTAYPLENDEWWDELERGLRPNDTPEELDRPSDEQFCAACGQHHAAGACVDDREAEHERTNALLNQLSQRLGEEQWTHVPEKEMRAVSNTLQQTIREMGASWHRAMAAIEQAANRWEEKAGEV
jgi:hypothetical protein